MKKQIWKFEIKDPSKTILEMPKNAQILTIQMQNEIPCIWALVTPVNEKELRHFEIYGTGHDIIYHYNTNREYINTFQMHNESLVFHLFERVN
jgi:hypothetical protein